MLFVVGRPESDVMYTAASQVGPRRVGTFDHPYGRPRTATPNFEGHLPATALRDLANLSEAEHLGEDPRSGIQPPNRQVDGPETPDAHLPRNRALLPRNTALYSFPLVSGEPKPLPFGVGEVEVSAVFTFRDPSVIHAEFLESAGPPLKRGVIRDAQLGSRDLASTGMVGGYAQMGPVEEGDLGPRISNLVSVEEVVGGDVVLIHRLLDEPQPEHVRVERHVLRGVRRDRRHVVQAAQFHLYPPIGRLIMLWVLGHALRRLYVRQEAPVPCTGSKTGPRRAVRAAP